MALTIRTTNPTTISDNLIKTAAGLTVAALAAVGIYQIGTTQFEPAATTTVSSYLPGTITPTETFSPELARANARQADALQVAAFSPELARVTQNSAEVSSAPTVAPNPAQAGAVSGPTSQSSTAVVHPLGGVR